jgi:hypothetical protein
LFGPNVSYVQAIYCMWYSQYCAKYV